MNINDIGFYTPWAALRAYTMYNPYKVHGWRDDFEIDGEIKKAIEAARKALKTTDFNEEWLEKEAIASCQIEDIRPDSTFVVTLSNALELYPEMSLNQRNINIIWKELMISDSVVSKCFRQVFVKVGSLTPCPYWDVEDNMREWRETYDRVLKSKKRKRSLDVLVEIAIFHAWFETIHPYADGNGRIGRAIILWMLHDCKALFPHKMIPSPSIYFFKNRQDYYDRLEGVRTKGDIKGWVLFFLKSLIPSKV